MLQITVAIKRSTLLAIREHSVSDCFVGEMPLSESESLVLLDQNVLDEIIRRAEPKDERIDDVIMRLVL